MFKSILKTFFANYSKNKLSFIITVLGFAIGLASTLLISIYIYHEWGYESMYTKKDRIYRVGITSNMSDKAVEFAANVPAFAPAIKDYIPEVENYVRINTNFWEALMKSSYVDNIPVRNVLTVDSSFFSLFDFRFVSGNASALSLPNVIVLTESVAAKLFGDRPALDQIITFNVGSVMKVGAVVKDPPPNTHLKFDALISMVTLPDVPVWDDAHSYTYILLNKQASISNVKQKLKKFAEESPYIASVEKSLNTKISFDVQSLPDIHLHSHRQGEFSDNSNPRLLYVLCSIAIFFLLISVFNYINIATATSLSRVKEIGVRKVLGASGIQVKLQFFAESLLIILFSFVLAVCICAGLLREFSSLMKVDLGLALMAETKFILIVFILIIIVTLLSGSYPSFYLSGLNPIGIFRKKGIASKGSYLSVRKILVIVQLMISTGIIICTVVAIRQLDYITNADIGFDRKNVLIFNIPDPAGFTFFKQELMRDPDVKTASVSNYSPDNAIRDEFDVEQETGEMQTFNVESMAFDYSFLDVMHIKMKDGRNFDPAFPSDPDNAFIVNETAVRFYGWKNPIGKRVSAKNFFREGTIVGVMKDASFFSLHNKKAPVIATLLTDKQYAGDPLLVRYDTKNINAMMNRMKGYYRQAFKDLPLKYHFLDDAYDRLYHSDQRYRRIVSIAAMIIIFISCLGLYGLSSFMAVKRKNEIGIRKVFGASDSQVMWLYLKGFFSMSVIGGLLAWPIAFLITHKWLQTFSLRIGIEPWIFLAASFITVLIVFLTTAIHATLLSRLNPVSTLRE